jgi:hypothetical protein
MTVSAILTLNGTITASKTRKLLDVNDTTAGSKGIIFTNESSAVSISVNVIAQAGNTIGYWELWSIGGDSDQHESLIYRSESESGIGVREKKLLAAGKLRLAVYYTGSAEFEFTAKGIESASVVDNIQPVIIELTNEDKKYRTEHIDLLCSIDNKLKAILNHQRLLTGMEKDEGDIF